MIKENLTIQIKGLEIQLAVLKAKLRHLNSSISIKSFADLYGILADKANSSEEEIGNVKYRIKCEGFNER